MHRLGAVALLLFALALTLATAESVTLALVSPIGEGADEWEHLDQALYLSLWKRLPDIREESVGQAQHPPLAYALQALAISAAARSPLGRLEDGGSAAAGLEILGRRTMVFPGRHGTIEGLDPNSAKERRELADQLPQAVFLAVRGVSVLLGLLSGILLLLGMRALFPERPALALGGSLFFVLLPSWSAHFAYASSDPFLTTFALLAATLALRAWRSERLGSWRRLLPIALVLGLAFLTKLHALGIALFVALLILGDRRSTPSLAGRLLRVGLVTAGPLVIAGWWYVLRLREAGGILVVDHHAELKPWLLRLQELHPVAGLDIVHELFQSFFGVVTATNVAAPTLFFVLPMSIATLALLGAFLFAPTGRRSPGRREPRAETADGATVALVLEAPRPAPLLPAWLALVLLLAAILVANRHYHHLHGRYFFAILLPLGLILGRGLDRLLGQRAGPLLAFAALWNLAFLAWTVHVSVMGVMTVPAEKFDRGRVVAYRDCGHRFFDDRSAGGYAALRQYPHLRLARHSIRATADDGLRYRFAIPDPTRPLQLRLRYPDASPRGQGEMPIATAISLFADDVMIHGPLSIGQARGEQIHPLPTEILQDGEITLRWENRAPGGFGVAVAEIWIEEAWVQASDLILDRGGRDLSFVIENIDQVASAHRVHLALRDRDGELGFSGSDADRRLTAGDRLPINLRLEREIDPATLDLVLRDPERGPLVDVKLATYRTAGARRSGLARLPDLETIRIDPATEPGALAEGDLGPLPTGRFDLVLDGLADWRGPEADASTALELDLEGGDGPIALDLPAPARGSIARARAALLRPDAAAAFRFRLRLARAPTGTIHLDRLRLRWPVDAPGWGQRYPLVRP